jgi:probable F420-dependent oxidoreductase
MSETVQQVNQLADDVDTAGNAGGAGPALPQLSIQIPNFAADPGSWQPTLDLARAADAAGIDRVAVSDHVVYGENLEAYADPKSGGTAGGKQPTGPDGHWLEPMTLLSVVAGITTRVRLGTGILLAALRRPAVLAKQTATLDVLSDGRLDLGVGVGWQREEYEACGLDFSRRGHLLDQTLAVCHALWTEQVADYDDGDLRFERIHAMPKPAQPGGVPIWVSGRINARTVERLARFGSGWIPWGDHVADPRAGIAAMREALGAAGRDAAALQVQGTLPVVRHDGQIDVDATMDRVPSLVAAGVTDFRFHNRWGVDPAADAALLAELVPAFRDRVGR